MLSSEPADWSVFQACLDTGKHIVPNGDISAIEDILYFKKLGIKEVMIGRAAVRNPSVFQLLKSGKLDSIDVVREKYLPLAEKYHSSPKFVKNVLSYLGKDVHSKKWLMWENLKLNLYELKKNHFIFEKLIKLEYGLD